RPRVRGAGGERRQALGREAVAGQVWRKRAIASAERRDRPPPALPRLGEAVQEDERLAHRPHHARETTPTRRPTISSPADLVGAPLDHGGVVTPPRDTYMALRAFVDELARCGLREACTS